MGDVAMVVPLLVSLLKAYPRLKITMLTKPGFVPIFSGVAGINIIPVQVNGRHKGVRGIYRLYGELTAKKIDAVADLHNVLRSRLLGILFRANKVPVQVIDKGRKEKRALTAWHHKKIAPIKTTLARYAEVFSTIGYPVELSPRDTVPKLHLPETFLRKKVKGNLPLLGIAPFAAYTGKIYPLHQMEKVIKALVLSQRCQILIFGGGKREKEISQKWEDDHENCFSLVGLMPFEHELSVISRLDAMLAMDSSNAHLAAMYGVPVVTLWGVTHPYTGFYPFAQDPNNALLSDRNKYPFIPTSVYGNKMPAGYEKCMETIDPETVVERVLKQF